MTARARLQAAADHVPLPAESLAGVLAAVLMQRARPLCLPGWVRPAGMVLAGGGLAIAVAAWRESASGDSPA